MVKVWKSVSILVIAALVLSLGLVMVPLAGTVGAETLYVGEGGYEDIQDAIDNASPGDTILVGPEKYYENLEISEGLDGLTIKSTDGAEVTTIAGTGPLAPGMAANGGGPVVNIYDVNGVTFQGFTVVGGTSFYRYCIPLPGCGIFMSNASSCLIANNIVKYNEAGIFVLGGTVNLALCDGMAEGVGFDGEIELVSNGNTIRNNEVCYNGYGPGGVGADGMMGTGYGITLINCQETTVKGNEVHSNDAGGILVIGGNISMMLAAQQGGEPGVQPPATFMGVARDNQIIDNEIYYEEPEGVMQLMMPPPGVMLLNTLRTTVSGNEIYDNYFGAIILGITGWGEWGWMEGEAKENVVSNNKIYENYFSGVAVVSTSGMAMSGDLFSEAVGNGISCYASDNDITDNTIEYAEYGIEVYYANNTKVSHNTIEENGHGVYVSSANNTRILGNDILNNAGAADSGVHVDEGSYGTEVHFNNIEGNSVTNSKAEGMSGAPESYAVSYGVYNHPENPLLDATFNWWRDASGPYDPEGDTDVKGCSCTNDPLNEKNEDGQGDAVSSNVDYCPWLLERFSPATSAPSTTGKGGVGFNTSDWNSAIIQLLEAKDPSEIDCPPKPEMLFPYGIFSFKVLVKEIGGTATIIITLPEDMPRGTQYWKCQNGEWGKLPLGSDDGDNILTLTLKDGGLGDADGVENGVIVDPGGPAIPIPLSTLTGEVKKAVEPASFLASYLQISPQQVSPNQPVEISINVANTGGESASRAVILYVNNVAEQSQTVTLAPGSAQNVFFTVSKATPGTYEVLLEGQNGQFVVKSTSVFGGGGLGTGGIIAIIVVLLALIVGIIFVMRGARGGA